MAQHILDLLRFHVLLLQSEHCVLLHGASEMGDSGGSACRPGEVAGARGPNDCGGGHPSWNDVSMSWDWWGERRSWNRSRS